ncbi:MAG: LacI family DNA-binding transcriptional regulator [Armatimonadota bacterium]|nr:LacI family DNA-binding transcriptional regulator [Armatimonadota bacterium]
MTNRSHPHRRRVTMADVARLAGVSQTTVSFVVNNIEAGLPESTKRRVLEACAKLNYSPNEAARRLASKISRAIGLAIYDIMALANYRQSAGVVLASVYQAAEARGQRLQIYTTHERKENGTDVGTYFAVPVRSREVDGIVIWDQYVAEERVTAAFEEGLPIVLLDRRIGEVPAVVPDYELGFSSLADSLLDRGYERFCLALRRGSCYRDVHAKEAFISRVTSKGLPANCIDIVELDIEAEVGPTLDSEIADRMLSTNPQALVCTYDTIALAAMAAFRKRGMRIPQDIAVVGCAGVPAAADPEYDLTTLHIRYDLMADHAVDMVLRMVKGERVSGSCVAVAPELIVRSSA